ncbi:hypothetical protein A3D77_07070 [Candidatus Gottesmanbacteria bacterium RIFCSPHIGHO2_02_FULL_39_11]|uniref:Glycosyltransferase RgtA/B/C/D-like domain-containing protein n=1 Tax=Candidatus Gottesmanbacteria bacterium RIFCSPHIGHO2_02_FULL_39_11 TaxID=1798382 RepID=A0A1F5ZJX3_9BACT|nr:MAG: hypothetical protein A3D77_07070 [Candidatus Gottesmanbacteria bacterium RIFCSPHIGHO2_02_FULL_39_11]
MRLSSLLILIILILSAFLRLYHIREYMTFLGDEGRDMLVVKRMIVNGEFTLLGPITSIGRMYMGPVYYYMISPFLALWNFDPVGPSIMVAVLSIATVYLIYFFCKKFFSARSALIAALFYAISPLTVLYGRASWNPNVVPFFSMLFILSLSIASIKKKYPLLILAGFSLGILIQLHYVTLLLGLTLILTFLLLIRPWPPLKYLIALALSFILGYSPFLLFELRHKFVNTQNTVRFILENKKEDVSIPLYISITAIVQDVTVRLFWRLLIVQSAELSKVFILSIGGIIFWIFKTKKIGKNSRTALLIILIWFLSGLILFSLYRGITYDYYFGSLFPIPFIILGISISFLWKLKNSALKIVCFGFLLYLIIVNTLHSPLQSKPNNILTTTEKVSQFVFNRVNNRPYNFALMALHNSDHAYRYFFDLWGNPPITIQNPALDPERKSVAPELWVICEDKDCKPLGNPLWEIAGFGPAEIEEEWKIAQVTVFKLVHL